MTIDQAVGLARKGEGPQRATLLELFLDLVFVAALALTSRTLALNLSWAGASQTVVLLMAIWWVWSVTALTTDLYHAQRPPIFVMTLWVMLGTILMAGTLPTAFSDHALVFAGAYVAIQVGRGIFLVAALHGRTVRLHAGRFIVWSVVSAVPWLAGALVAGSPRGLLWASPSTTGRPCSVTPHPGSVGYPCPSTGWQPTTWRSAISSSSLSPSAISSCSPP
jgi:low temperature requirement protein LtrA